MNYKITNKLCHVFDENQEYYFQLLYDKNNDQEYYYGELETNIINGTTIKTFNSAPLPEEIALKIENYLIDKYGNESFFTERDVNDSIFLSISFDLIKGVNKKDLNYTIKEIKKYLKD
ncbi:MAG: hypothetical protein LBM96_06030 [Methanobrevibacter sp.]|jgi:hypothetical protein|nr:hypothetical protein [Candidatus Methanoflexus mossambicus]